MNKGGRFTVVVLGYMMKLPNPGIRPALLCRICPLVNLLTSPICNPLLLTANCTGKPEGTDFHPFSFP
jgi:hypothetical protein